MSNQTVTVSQVIHPITREVLALEIVANNGMVYFAGKPGTFSGICVGPFPSVGWIGHEEGASLTHMPAERVEIARLEPTP